MYNTLYQKDYHASCIFFIYSRINYGIEVYDSCADEDLSKLQVM